MNRFIASLKCLTKQLFCLPLSIKTLFSETSVTHTLLLASGSHFGAHHSMYNQEFFSTASFIIFVLNDLIYDFMRGLYGVLLLTHLVLPFCALSLLGNAEDPLRSLQPQNS